MKQNNVKKFIRNVFGYCEYCNRYFVYPKKFRRNTAFVDDSQNYMVGCKDCEKRDFEEYEEMCRDYWSSRL